MAILQRKKLRIKKIKKFAQGHDERVTTSKQIIIEHLLCARTTRALETQWKQNKLSMCIVVLQSPVPCCLTGTEENSNHEASLSSL